MRRILGGRSTFHSLDYLVVFCALSFPAKAVTLVTGSVQTMNSSGVVDCEKNFASSNGGFVFCLSEPWYAAASGTAAFGNLSATAERAGPARANSSASYDEMVFITGGVGVGMLTIVYRAEKQEGSGILITQGNQFSDVCAAELGPSCSMTSTFIYDVTFRMRSEVSAIGGDIRFQLPGHAELQILSTTDQAGSPVTLNIVPEPGTLLITGLGLAWVCRKRMCARAYKLFLPWLTRANWHPSR